MCCAVRATDQLAVNMLERYCIPNAVQLVSQSPECHTVHMHSAHLWRQHVYDEVRQVVVADHVISARHGGMAGNNAGTNSVRITMVKVLCRLM